MTATNAANKRAERQVSVVIANAAPIADFGEDLFVSEDGVEEVELDLCGGVRIDGGCTTRDPDGDELEFYGFQFTGDGGPTLPDAGPGRVRFTPPANWQRPLVFSGVVSDGIESSVGTVRVFRGGHAWVNAGFLDQSWRIHPDFRATTRWSQPTGSTLFHSEAIVADGVGGWWFGDSLDNGSFTGPSVVIHLDANLNELEVLVGRRGREGEDVGARPDRLVHDEVEPRGRDDLRDAERALGVAQQRGRARFAVPAAQLGARRQREGLRAREPGERHSRQDGDARARAA